MKAIVFSDSHRSFSGILQAMEQEPQVDWIIHAGDVQQDVEDIQVMWPSLPCAYVLGNNDYAVRDVPTRREFILAGKRVLLTHGHLYGVKSSLARLEREAEACRADICIFGHTHIPHLEQKNGIWFLNPGSARRNYAVLTIEDGTVDIVLK